ncbi:MAG: acyltransferase 3 [Caulobacteraceae bacterium]|nr:acyltransferase 3 [Caulobacteraceae bacterium]
MTAERKQYYTLHGLRGVAAIIVVFYHLWPYLRGRQNFTPGAYLAVDLFFILSGFVIAHAYDRRLAGGMGFKAFAVLRMIRLGPLYYLGLLIAVIGIGVGMISGARHAAAALITSILAGLAWLPTPPGLSVEPSELFPLNGPAWSLLLEILVNFAYALVGPRLGPRALGGVILASGAALVWCALHYGDLNHGAGWHGGLVGVARVVFSFSLGVMMRRRMGATPYVSSNALSLMVLAAAAAVMVWPYQDRAPFDLATVFVAWPLVIYCGARFEASGRMQAWLGELGDLSYGLYATHVPVLMLSAGLLTLAFGWPRDDHSHGYGFTVVGITVLFAALAHHLYDVPLRRRLTGWATAGKG